MKKLLLTLGALCLITSFSCKAITKNLPELLSVEPASVKMRHAQDIKVKIKNWQPGMQLSITPGGAYVKSNASINTNKNILTSANKLWIMSDKQINIYDKTLKFIKSIPLQKNIQKIAIFNQTLLTATEDQLYIFHINQETNITEEFHQIYKNNILKISLSDSHACLLLDNNQLLRLNLKTQENIRSALHQKPAITHINTLNDTCLSINDKQAITLWQENKRTLTPSSSYRSNEAIYEAHIYDKKIILANGNNGLTILDAENNTLQWLGSYNKLGNIVQLANQDHQVLVADDRGVMTLFDISNTENPLLIANFHLHDTITDLSFIDDSAYAVTTGKIQQIDFSSNSTPTISTLGVNQGGSRRSFIKDNILYVADWFSGLHLYDISIPRAPRLLSSFHTPGSPKGVIVRKNTAFVADDDHGLQIIDVSDPLKPTLISELPLPGLAYTMKLIDDLLYIASHRGGFHIVDVSQEKLPTLLSSYDTPGKAWAVEYQSGLLYVADDNSGLMIFDVTDPKTPKLINQFNPGGFAEDIILKDNKAYIAFFDLGLVIMDITNPLKLKQLAQLKTPGNARGIEIKNNLLYLASWEAGVLIIDISHDSKPQILGHYDTKGATWGLSVKDLTLYAMDWWGGVKVLDVKNPQQPTFLGQYQTAGKINDILYQDNFIYTAHGSRGLQIYDASNSLNPVWATGLDFDGDAKAIALNNSLALVAAGDGGLVLADTSNPFQVEWLAQIAIPTSADMVQTVDALAFVATQNGDLFVIDISEPTKAHIINRQSASTEAIQSFGHSLLQLNKNHTLRKYTDNKLTSKLNVEQYSLDFAANILSSKNQEIFLASHDGEIQRLNFVANRLHKTSTIKLAEQLIAIHIHNNQLFGTTKSNKLYVLNIEDPHVIQLQSIYPTTHDIEMISISNDGIFLSGESSIASGKLLPDIKILRSEANYLVKIPENMPLGAYNINISSLDGQQKTTNNAFQIAFPKLKSKFTMNDLKRKMKQQNLPGKASSQPQAQ